MIRIVLGMIIGAAIGAGITYQLVGREPVPAVARDAVPPTAPIRPVGVESGLPRVGPGPAGALPPRGFDVSLDAPIDAVAAETSIEALVARIGSLRSPQDQRIALAELMNRALTFENPQRLLELSDELPASMAGALRQAAMQGWAQRDAPAALAYAEAMPLGQSREIALSAAAMSFARQDPDAALAWLEAQTSRTPALESAVYNGIAQGDPLKAAELLLADRRLESNDPMRIQYLMPMLMRLGQGAGAQRPALADRLLRAPGVASEQLLPMFLQSWAQTDPRAAMNWIADQGPSVGTNAYAQLAAALANQDVMLAAEFTPRVPAAARTPWLVAVGQAYARQDPAAAVAWLEQYGGQEGYADALLATAQSVAMFDPVRAAELYSRVDTNNVQATGAAGVIASMWARTDAAAARSWAVGLAPGPQRDAALSVLIASGAQSALDEGLLALMSSEDARGQATLNGIMRIAAGDTERARTLLETYVSDPALRARYEATVSNMGGRMFDVRMGTSAGVVVGPSGQVYSRSEFFQLGPGPAIVSPAEQGPSAR